jgi:2-polyprenyl-3-methyl-5-hydroxy-6-metoxy-1,4-benzoquinol methylase
MSIYANNTMATVRPNDAWFKLFTFVPPKARVLDVGCSSGNLGKALKEEKGAFVVGVDIDEPDIKKAKKVLDEAHIVDLEKDDLSQLGSFDVIIMADVIEHLVDPVTVLTKLRPLLKAGGRFVFSIPNMSNVTTRLEILRGRFEYKDFGLLDRTHIHYYDHEEVDRIFREAGYRIVGTDCTIRIVPEDILRKDLAAMGLELTPKFKQHLENTEAQTYQFIGYAVPGKPAGKFKIKTTSPLDSISKEIDDLRAHYEAELKQRDADAAHWKAKYEKAAAELEKAAAELEKAAAELDAIHHLKGWKVLEKAYAINTRLKGRGK